MILPSSALARAEAGCANELPCADVHDEFVATIGTPVDQRPTVAQYIDETYGIRHDFIGYVVLILFAYIITFLGVSALALKKLNFQQK